MPVCISLGHSSHVCISIVLANISGIMSVKSAYRSVQVYYAGVIDSCFCCDSANTNLFTYYQKFLFILSVLFTVNLLPRLKSRCSE